MPVPNQFTASNPWPDPVPDPGCADQVWRAWTVTLDAPVDAGVVTSLFSNAGDVRVEVLSDDRFVIKIRSDDPATCDMHEVMNRTRQIILQIDAVAPIRRLQGVLKDKWLFLRT